MAGLVDKLRAALSPLHNAGMESTAGRHVSGVSVPTVVASIFVAWLTWSIWSATRNVYLHPLSRFPGPKIAAATTWWHAFVEAILNLSFQDVLEGLHSRHGWFIVSRRISELYKTQIFLISGAATCRKYCSISAQSCKRLEPLQNGQETLIAC